MSKQERESYKNFNWNDIPDDIVNINDQILNDILYCELSHRPYKINSAELLLYRKMNIPIPRLHPNERHKKRMDLRNI